ncbi:MAG: amidohydrolase family protein [Dehalococcoidia bacterium]
MPDYRVIDADGHVDPAPVCDWNKYVRSPFGEIADQMAKKGYDVNGDRTTTRRGGFDPVARIADMDEEGIDVTVLFGGTMGISTGPGEPPGLGPAIAEGYNNWLHDFCSHNQDRLRGAAIVAPEDIVQACKEARRAVTELGAVGIAWRPVFTDTVIDDPAFFPLYQVAEELDVPVLVHGPGDVRQWLSQRYHTHFRRHAVDFPISLMMASMDVVCGGLLEKFKRLRIAFLEGSVGWVPWWLDRLDEHFEKLPHHVPHIREKPRELAQRYIQEGRLFFSCEPDEAYLPFVADAIGDDFIVYASDYPHWDAIYPGSVRAISERAELPEGTRRKILGENAARLFGAHF